MWVRGLKPVTVTAILFLLSVAPYVGAWIETPLIGWATITVFSSHPMWVRGLKLVVVMIE